MKWCPSALFLPLHVFLDDMIHSCSHVVKGRVWIQESSAALRARAFTRKMLAAAAAHLEGYAISEPFFGTTICKSRGKHRSLGESAHG